MSNAIALVRFKDGTIYRGCFYGTSDILMRNLITEEELEEKFDGFLYSFFQHITSTFGSRIDLSTITDSEDVEIYIDYGSGAMAEGTASKSKMYLTSDNILKYYGNSGLVADDDHIRQWVLDYFVEHGWDTSHIGDKIII